MSSYDILRVGLPITTNTITTEFLDVVKELSTNDKWVGVMLCDHDDSYKTKRSDQHNAPAGYKVLIDSGFTFHPNILTGTTKIIGTFGSLWGTGSDRNPLPTAIQLLSKLKDGHAKQNFDMAVLFTPGSPYCDDSITRILKSAYADMTIIDTKSSADIVSGIIGRPCIVRDYYEDFILQKDCSIDRSKVSVFSCLQNGYNTSLRDAIINLAPVSVIAVSLALDRSSMITYTYNEALSLSEELFNSDTTYTFGFSWVDD